MLRRRLKAWVLEAVEPSVRDWIRQAQAPDPSAKLAELEEKNAKLEKKLSMAVGAVQAATTQLMAAKQTAEQASNLAQQAMQRATSAQAAAEAAAEGVSALEAARPEVARPTTKKTSRKAGKPEPV